MAKSEENVGAEAQPEAQAQAQRQPRQIQVDESKMVKSYANFCRVTPGFEELIIDFGLSPQPIGAPEPIQPVVIDQRLIVNYFMAKRLLSALAGSIQRYEQIFGVLETDVQKRVQIPARTQAAPAAAPAQS